MDIGRLVTLLRGTLQPEERIDAEKQLIEVCRTALFSDIFHFNADCFDKMDCLLRILFESR